MNIEYHKWWSPNLGQDMELKDTPPEGARRSCWQAGHRFPTQGGRFYEYEDFGMVELHGPPSRAEGSRSTRLTV
jgi:esterase/lipase superfamily enzyme